MKLPDLLEAHNVPIGKYEPHGIIYKLKQKGVDLLSNVIPSTNTDISLGNIESVVTWDDAVQTHSNPKAYIQIEFKDRYVFATHYSFKGYTTSDGRSYQKQWYLCGLNSPDDEPVNITTNTSVGSTFCGSDTWCNSNSWATFAIPNPKRAFRILRFIVKEPSYIYWVMLLGGLEVFGIYSKDGRTKVRRTYCFKSYPLSRHAPILGLLNMIIITCS